MPPTDRTVAQTRQALKGPAVKYLVVVRYDDGAYAVVEHDKRPQRKKGDRVKLEAGASVPVP